MLRYDSPDDSSSPVACSNAGINSGSDGFSNAPAEPTICETVCRLTLLTSGTVFVMPSVRMTGRIASTIRCPFFPNSESHARMQSLLSSFAVFSAAWRVASCTSSMTRNSCVHSSFIESIMSNSERFPPPRRKSCSARQQLCRTRHWFEVRFVMRSSRISFWYSSTVFCVSVTSACQMRVIEFCRFGVGSNWYRYSRGMIFGRYGLSCSPAFDAIVRKPNAAPFFEFHIVLWFAICMNL